MKKDIKWLKEKLQTMINQEYRCYDPLIQQTKHTCKVIMDLIDQLDEPEKVVIPQFVADYIEHAKPRHDSLYQAMEERAGEEVNEWVQAFYNSNKFARAWLDGYEVEKEKKYYVLDSHGKTILVKLFGKRIAPSQGRVINNLGKHNSDYQFTEQEIKNYDKRYWAFAEEVTE